MIPIPRGSPTTSNGSPPRSRSASPPGANHTTARPATARWGMGTGAELIDEPNRVRRTAAASTTARGTDTSVVATAIQRVKRSASAKAGSRSVEVQASAPTGPPTIRPGCSDVSRAPTSAPPRSTTTVRIAGSAPSGTPSDGRSLQARRISFTGPPAPAGPGSDAVGTDPGNTQALSGSTPTHTVSPGVGARSAGTVASRGPSVPTRPTQARSARRSTRTTRAGSPSRPPMRTCSGLTVHRTGPSSIGTSSCTRPTWTTPRRAWPSTTLGLPVNDATSGLAGRAKTSTGGSHCSTVPAPITAIRSPRAVASPRSWVTSTVVTARVAFSSPSSARSAVRAGPSTALNGSSSSSRSRSPHRARANETRCCSPPESPWGRSRARSARPTSARSSPARARRRARATPSARSP